MLYTNDRLGETVERNVSSDIFPSWHIVDHLTDTQTTRNRKKAWRSSKRADIWYAESQGSIPEPDELLNRSLLRRRIERRETHSQQTIDRCLGCASPSDSQITSDENG